MPRKKAAVRVVNIDPDDIELTNSRWLDSKFVITFVQWKDGQVVKYNVRLDFFFLGLIIDAIRDVLKHTDDAIREIKSNLRRTGS